MLSKINEQYIKKVLLFFVYGVMIFYPMTMFVVKGLRTDYLGILFLLFLVALSLRRIRPMSYVFSKQEAFFLISYTAIFIIALISYLALSDAPDAGKRLSTYSFFLVAPSLYFLFKYTQPRIEIIWAAIVMGCYIAFGRALLEVLDVVKDISWPGHNVGFVDRANGTMHPIRFGDLTLLMGFISLAGAFYLRDIKIGWRTLGVLGGGAGIIASFLSQSRGGWLAIPFMIVVLLWPKYMSVSRLGKSIVLLSVISVLVALIYIPNLNVLGRYDNAKNDIAFYMKGGTGTSLGTRFDMAKTAVNIIKEHPILGVGLGNYHQYAVDFYQQNKSNISAEVKRWRNPHNEILLQWVTRGVAGLISVILMFWWSFKLFYSNRKNETGQYCFPAIAGMLIISGYFFFGQSIALFEHRDFTLFFVIYVMFFAAAIKRNKSLIKG